MKKHRVVILTVSILAVALLLGTLGVNAQDEVLNKTKQQALGNCRDQYVQALIAYNGSDKSKVPEFLQAAANIAKDVDATLADLIGQLREDFTADKILSFAIAQRIAIIFNTYKDNYNLGYPMFNPGNPTLANPE